VPYRKTQLERLRPWDSWRCEDSEFPIPCREVRISSLERKITMIGDWLTLYTKPRQERKVAAALTGRGIETYFPVMDEYSTHSRRLEPSPFFPCYLFARVDLSACSFAQLQWTPGLRSIVRFSGKMALISDSDIAHIRQRLNDLQGSMDPMGCGFTQGDRVRIVTGPLQDLEAVFDRPLSKRQRVRILLDFLGRTTACEIEPSSLEKVSQSN